MVLQKEQVSNLENKGSKEEPSSFTALYIDITSSNRRAIVFLESRNQLKNSQDTHEGIS